MNNFEAGFIIGCIVAAALVFVVAFVLRQQRRMVSRLSDKLRRCHVRNSDLDDECRRLAWAAADQMKSLKKEFESRAIIFRNQHQSLPHMDHEQRAVGYQEASATMEGMIQEMEKRGGGQQKIKVDL